MRVLRLFCLGLGVLLANQSWAGACHMKDFGTLPVEMLDYRATTLVKVNGADARFMLDTGAFFNTTSRASATALKLDSRIAPMGFRISGVGGEANAEIYNAKDFGIVGTTLHDIDFIVGGTDAGYGLLGANLLDFADLEIDLADGKLTFFKPEQCDDAILAYWVKDGGDYNVADLDPSEDRRDRRSFLSVTINGKRMRALLDSGATATVLSRSAAERAGINLSGPDAKPAGQSSGIGSQLLKTWIARVETISVGTETIHHSQMQVIDGSFGDDDVDLLLGVDFLLAHHMFIANSQGKAYFTYNGSRVFSLAAASGDNDKSDVGAPAGQDNAPPKTAENYVLLGEAHLSRGETNAALADLQEAVRMAPDQAAYHVALARAQVAAKQADAALAELDKALSLEPKNIDALLARAQLRFWRKDRAGADADITVAKALVPAGSGGAYSIAVLYIQLEQPAAALPLLDDWIRLHDDDALLGAVLNERCWARGLSIHLLDDALKDCRKAIRRDGEKPAYLDSLGMIELRLGQYPEAIKTYEQAIAGHRSAWSLYGLGLAKIRNGQTDAGTADLAAARALDPAIDTLAGKYGLAAGTP